MNTDMSERRRFKKDSGNNWIQNFMKNKLYNIIDNEGGGDCLFSVIRDAFKSINKDISVSDLRKIISKNADMQVFQNFKEQYDMYKSEIASTNKNLRTLVKEIDDLRQKKDSEKDRNRQKAIVTEANKKYVLLTNAPRPNKTVNAFLEEMGMSETIRKKVYSSGEVALNYLKKNHLNEMFYHVGPPKDFDLFVEFENNKRKNIKESSYLLCTGLIEGHDEDLNYYKELFKDHTDKKMICTNPDLIVDRGNKRELCAGSIALVFEKIGGKVMYFGKPFPEVYNQSIDNKKKKVLSIGDNLNTDIKGANLLNFDSLIISNGIHKNEIEKEGIEKVSKNYDVVVNFIQSELKW